MKTNKLTYAQTLTAASLLDNVRAGVHPNDDRAGAHPHGDLAIRGMKNRQVQPHGQTSEAGRTGNTAKAST